MTPNRAGGLEAPQKAHTAPSKLGSLLYTVPVLLLGVLQGAQKPVKIQEGWEYSPLSRVGRKHG